MSQSIRVFYGKEKGLHGRCRMNFNWPPITLTSAVNVTAGEATDEAAQTLAGLQGFSYNLGAANVWVSNISPHAGGVEFILNVDWPSPLNIAVTITLEDGAPQQFRDQ